MGASAGCVQPAWRQSKDEEGGLKWSQVHFRLLIASDSLQKLRFMACEGVAGRESVAALRGHARGLREEAPPRTVYGDLPRLEPHVPPPLVALQELKREPRPPGPEMELLLEPSATPLALEGLLGAVAFGHEAEALMLISGGAPLDHRDAEGRTALHCAAARGSEAISRMLLDAWHGAKR